MSMEPDVPSIFDELERQRPPLIHASIGERFVNSLVDGLLIFGINYLLSYLLIYVSEISGTGFMDFAKDNGWNGFLPNYLYRVLLSASIYSLIEGIFKGKTLGKLITGTRAVREDGSIISMKDAFTRSICRYIPFEALTVFSAGNVMWHDRFSRTRVVKETHF